MENAPTLAPPLVRYVAKMAAVEYEKRTVESTLGRCFERTVRVIYSTLIHDLV